MRRSSLSPAVACSVRSASGRGPWRLVLRPWMERPSIQSVASLWLTQSRSTRSPSHSGGMVASSLNQKVVQAGPNCSPSEASR